MESLIKASVRYKSIVFLTIALIVFSGLFSYLSLPQNEDPQVTPNAMMIFIMWPGASTEDVELYVTKPLENAIAKQDYIKEIKTESLPGFSTAEIRISSYASPEQIKKSFQDIRNYISDAKMEFPPNVYIFINDRYGETEAYVLSLTSDSDKRSYREMKAMMEKIKDELKSVKGAGDFRFYGDIPEKIYINLSSDDLATMNLNPYIVMNAIQKQNEQVIQPKFHLADKEILIEVTGNYETIEQVRDTIVYTDKSGKNYTIRDLKGNVTVGYDDHPFDMARVDGQKSLVMSVSMKRGFHIVNWGKKIDRKLDEIRRNLPSDVHLKTVFNQPTGVDDAVKGFMVNFIQSVILVIIVMGIGMGIRNAGIVSVSIPLIILFTFTAMKIFGIELHQMSINAMVIALGMVVDNSVVVIDNISRYMSLGYSKVDAAIKGTTEVLDPLFWGTLITVTSFAALVFMPGALGQYMGSLPRVISITLIASFFMASLLIPSLATFFLSDNKKKDSKPGFLASLFGKKKENETNQEDAPKRKGLFERIYSAFVDFTQRFKAVTLLIIFSLLLLSGYLAVYHIPLSFFPAADKTQFVVKLFLPHGYDIHATDEKVKLLEKKLDELRETKLARPPGLFEKESPPAPLIVDYATYVGRFGPKFYIALLPVPPKARMAQIMVTTSSGWHTRKAVKELRKFINENFSGGKVEVKLLELAFPVDYPVEVLVTGNEISTLREIGDKIENILKDTDGITSVENNFGTNSQKLVVKIDQSKAKQLGLNTSDVSQQIYAAVQGAPVSRFKAPERGIDLVIRLREKERRSVEDLKAIWITSSADGSKHRLDEFAEIYFNDFPSVIMRRDERRTLTVGATIDEDKLVFNILKDIKPRVKEIKVPEGYSITYAGTEKESMEAFGDLIPLGVLAMIAMFITLSFKFKSFKIAMSVYMSIPMAITGAVFGLYIMKLPLGFMASLGMISLVGIVIYNAIIMVEFIQIRLHEGMDALSAIKEAGITRTRPILMTTITTLGGLLPLALSKNPLFEPLTWVIIYGLGFSTIMTLLITPLWFVLFGGVKDTLSMVEYEKADEEEEVEKEVEKLHVPQIEDIEACEHELGIEHTHKHRKKDDKKDTGQ